MQKDTFYFPHESNAMNDAGILTLRTVHGPVGYAAYFMLLEILREQPGYKIKLDKYFYGTVSSQMKIDKTTFEKIIDDCINEFSDSDGPLVSYDGEYIWANRLLRVMKKLDESRAKRAEAGKKGMASRWSKTDNDVITNDNSKEKESKVNESKVNESKVKEIKEEKETFKSGGGGEACEPDPVENYFSEKGLDPDAYFGASEETKKDSALLTLCIFKRFTPDKTPTDYDKRRVFCNVIDWRLKENDEREGFISRDKKDLLIYAFEAAAKAGKPGDWKYIDGVMRNNAKRKITSLKAAEDYDIDREERAQGALGA